MIIIMKHIQYKQYNFKKYQMKYMKYQIKIKIKIKK